MNLLNLQNIVGTVCAVKSNKGAFVHLNKLEKYKCHKHTRHSTPHILAKNNEPKMTLKTTNKINDTDQCSI